MIEKIYDSNVVLYIIFVVCGLSVVTRIALLLRYRSLINEASSPGNGKRTGYSGRFIRRITDKFACEYEKSYIVNNVSIFVEKYMYEVKMLGIKSSAWESVEILAIILCLAAGTLGAFGAHYYREEQAVIIRYALEGLIAAGVIIISDALFDLTIRRNELHTIICDYLENYMKPRLERGEYNSLVTNNVKLVNEIDEGMLELLESMDNSLCGEEDSEPEDENIIWQKQDKDDRIIEDVIREYLT